MLAIVSGALVLRWGVQGLRFRVIGPYWSFRIRLHNLGVSVCSGIVWFIEALRVSGLREHLEGFWASYLLLAGFYHQM